LAEKTQSIAEFLRQFESARGHLKQGQREMLMALRDFVKVFADLSEQSAAEYFGVPANVLRGFGAVLDYVIAQYPESGEPPEEINAIQKQALADLIKVLDAETKRTAAQAATQVDLAKVEALQGLMKYLEEQAKSLSDESAAAKQRRQRVTKIDID
jgi:hypothetical protein